MPNNNADITFKYGYQDEYDEIEQVDDNAIYVITDTHRIYIGGANYTEDTQMNDATKHYVDSITESIRSDMTSQIGSAVDEKIGDSVEDTTVAWLNENVNPVGSAVVVDNSLSISGAAADSKTVGDYKEMVDTNLSIFNCTTKVNFDVYTNSPSIATTRNGIDITPVGKMGYNFSGTASGIVTAQYLRATTRPDWSYDYVFIYPIFVNQQLDYTGLSLRVNVIDNEHPSGTLFKSFKLNDEMKFKLPDTATGFSIYIRIESDITIDNTLYIVVNNGVMPNIKATNNFYDDIMIDFINSIYKIGVIGDSYSAIRLYPTGAIGDYPELSWVKRLENMTGMSYENFAVSGYEANDWINGTTTRPEQFTNASQQDKLCQLYIVCLGINDCSRHDISYVGTTADINVSNPDENANSFIGNYAKIIQKLKAVQPNALFCVVTMPTHTTNSNENKYNVFNDGIRAIANFFDYCFLIDLYADYYDLYHAEYSPLKNPNGNFIVSGHYTAEVQGIIAKIFKKEISKIMYENQNAFLSLCTNGQIWQNNEICDV